MAWLILQILWFLIVAAAIGGVVGWLCRSLAIERRRETAAMQSHAAQGELEGERSRLEARLAEAMAERKALQAELAQARDAAQESAKSLRKLEREHSSTLVRLEAREREVARLSAGSDAAGQAIDTSTGGVAAPLLGAEDPPASAPPDDARGEAAQDDPDRDKSRGKARLSGSFAQHK